MVDTQQSLGEKPQTRDLDRYFDSLSQWVGTNLQINGTATLQSVEPTSSEANGFAGESFIIAVSTPEAGEQKYLLKRKPTKLIYFPDHDFEAEYRIQELLHTTGHAPVAPTYGYEADPSVAGSPFYILGFVPGEPTPDRPPFYAGGWVKDASEEQQRAVCVSGLEALAKLHSKTIDQLGADFLLRAAPGQSELDWDIARWDRFTAVGWRDEPLDLVKETRQWLEDNKPQQSDLVVSWGDARPGNMLFQLDKCNAIIDWDLVSCGEPETDLGFWLTFDLQFLRSTEAMGETPSLPGWPSYDEMIEIYSKALGRDIDMAKLRFYRIYAAWQCGILYARFMTMRSDLPDEEWATFVNEQAPPIAMMAETMSA